MPVLEYNGTRIAWESAGPSDAPALVFLHAGIATGAMWDAQWDDVQRDHHVIRYDLRWFGRSASDDVPYSNRADLIAVMDAAGVDRATFVGASYGGSVAIDTALEYPDRMAGLVTIGSGPGGFPAVDLTPREEALMGAVDEAEQARDWERLVALEADFWGAGPTRAPDGLDPSFRRTLRELGRANIPLLDADPDPQPLEPRAYTRLGDIRAPALFIVGEHDTSAARAQAEHLADAVPDSSLRVFPDAAHMPSVEHPDRFIELLRSWLTEKEL